jgi:hypothetical protein
MSGSSTQYILHIMKKALNLRSRESGEATYISIVRNNRDIKSGSAE